MATAPQLEVELQNVRAKIAALETKVAAAREWEAELVTALKVEHRLSQQDAQREPKVITTFLNQEPTGPYFNRRGRTRSANVAAADAALTAILRNAGTHIKQPDAVRRLKEDYNIVVGSGDPERATSDLSAALGNGKSDTLVVTRKNGWGLVEWIKDSDPVTRNDIAEEMAGLYYSITKELGAFNDQDYQDITRNQLQPLIDRYDALEQENPHLVPGEKTW